MKIIIKTIKVIRDIFELYIPSVVFLLMFAVFVLQIFARYILRNPLPWTMELTLICFCYLVTLGACYAARKKTHVIFTLLYDSVSTPFKYILSIMGNCIIISAFLIMLKPSYSFIKFMSFQRTSVLKINMSIVFAPFLILIVDVVIYQIIELVEAVLSVKNKTEVSLIDRTNDTELSTYFKNKKMKSKEAAK